MSQQDDALGNESEESDEPFRESAMSPGKDRGGRLPLRDGRNHANSITDPNGDRRRNNNTGRHKVSQQGEEPDLQDNEAQDEGRKKIFDQRKVIPCTVSKPYLVSCPYCGCWVEFQKDKKPRDMRTDLVFVFPLAIGDRPSRDTAKNMRSHVVHNTCNLHWSCFPARRVGRLLYETHPDDDADALYSFFGQSAIQYLFEQWESTMEVHCVAEHFFFRNLEDISWVDFVSDEKLKRLLAAVRHFVRSFGQYMAAASAEKKTKFWYNLTKNLSCYAEKQVRPAVFEEALKSRFTEVRAAIERGTTLANMRALVQRGPPQSTIMDTPAKVVFSLVMDALYKGDTRESPLCRPKQGSFYFVTKAIEATQHGDRTKYLFRYYQMKYRNDGCHKLEYKYKCRGRLEGSGFTPDALL